MTKQQFIAHYQALLAEEMSKPDSYELSAFFDALNYADSIYAQSAQKSLSNGIDPSLLVTAGKLFHAFYPYGDAYCDADGNYYNSYGARLRAPSEYGADADGVYTPFGDE